MARIAFKKAPVDPQLTRVVSENRTRYVWYPGPAPKGVLDFCPADTDIGISRIPRGQVVQVTTHRYCIRDTDDRGTPGAEKIPNVHRNNEDGALIMVPIRAGQITDWLERRYGAKGFVVLEELIDQGEDRVLIVVNSLITEDDEAILRTMTLQDMRRMIENGRAAVLDKPDVNSLYKDLVDKTADRMLGGIDTAQQYILNELDTLKQEMTQRRVANGTGIVSLPPTALAMLPLVSKQAGEYQLDSEEMQRNLFQMIGQKFSGPSQNDGGMNPGQIADIISAVLTQIGFKPPTLAPPVEEKVEAPVQGKKK